MRVIKEEGLLEEDDYQKPLPRRCYFLAFVLGFFVLFTFFSLILWAAARSQKPKIEIKSVKFERFLVSSGSDATGVATEMASVYCTLKFLYRNTATFNLWIYALLNCFHLSAAQLLNRTVLRIVLHLCAAQLLN